MTDLDATLDAMIASRDSRAEDWDTLWWVRMRGTARQVDGERADAALDALEARYEQYRGRRPTGAVVAIEPDAWSGWEASPR